MQGSRRRAKAVAAGENHSIRSFASVEAAVPRTKSSRSKPSSAKGAVSIPATRAIWGISDKSCSPDAVDICINQATRIGEVGRGA
jgi:hypothetical protein